MWYAARSRSKSCWTSGALLLATLQHAQTLACTEAFRLCMLQSVAEQVHPMRITNDDSRSTRGRFSVTVQHFWACRADEVICSSDENVVARVKEITGRKMAYAAVDCVAGEMTDTVAASTREGGTVYVSMQLPVQAAAHSLTLDSDCRMLYFRIDWSSMNLLRCRDGAGVWIHGGNNSDRGSRQFHIPPCPCHRFLVSPFSVKCRTFPAI